MMITDNRKPEWFFYPGWVVLSAISIPIAWVIYWALISLIKKVVGGTIQVGGQTRITEDFLLLYILCPALSLVTGLLQYLLLRRYLQRMGWWIATTTLGWSLAFIGGSLLYRASYTTLDVNSMGFVALSIVLVGGAIGLAQWLVLRRRVRYAAWWILANVLGWGALIVGETFSSLLAFLMMPAIATSFALWLLLDKLPQCEAKGR
jgi:hypothetical protein